MPVSKAFLRSHLDLWSSKHPVLNGFHSRIFPTRHPSLLHFILKLSYFLLVFSLGNIRCEYTDWSFWYHNLLTWPHFFSSSYEFTTPLWDFTVPNWASFPFAIFIWDPSPQISCTMLIFVAAWTVSISGVSEITWWFECETSTLR